MNNMTKMALISAGVLSMGALTACQSTTAPKDADHGRMMKQHHGDHERKMSPEQREHFKEMRAEQRQVFTEMQKACDSKTVGTAVQVKAGDKAIDGTCVMTFKADRKAMKEARGEHKPMRGEHRPMRGDMQGHMQRGEPMTDAQRAELTKQFDQRLAQRQAKQQAIAKACQGKTDGTAVAFKVGEQQINGKCEVRFQPKAPVAPTAAPVK
ncbi:hypothetical protein B9T33_07705 [Acinetobacter sp. ANC 5054]|uniref:hypothetical protein n=1 Tax=Acinetobacter sp. ANC 5054 TaxID=1977877 RepID=UPI000A336B96|nr:hypothetical protein [Acinetobacter sp. ANC 5054]OTG80856.1 hypothetical protein B9T33_07705 [Acinetobacter sp. ANC 5054]